MTDRILSLNMRYFGGDSWDDDWDSRDAGREGMTGRIPDEIEIEITLVDQDALVTLRTIVSPPMAVKP
jgi:hypothetical protein